MGFFDSLFGGKKSNPANKAMPYYNQIPGMTAPYFQPYINAGQQAIPHLQEQYGGLLGDPAGFINKIGAGYKESPGLQFAIQKALDAAGRASAAGGMAGSPAHQEQNIGLATGFADQDYNQWLQHALSQYNTGLAGEQGLAAGGLGAGQSMADMIAQTLAQQGNMAFRGQQEQNSMNNSLLGGLGRLGGAALGGFAGGPWGAFAGWNASR